MISAAYSSAIALFVRQPVPGRVKTRLARDLGDVAACRLYCAMVADALAQIVESGMPLYLFHDGDAAGLPSEWHAAAACTVRQTGDCLGERMTAAFEYIFSDGMDGVVVMGSDIPGIGVQVLRDVSVSLDNHDLVIVPAVDGGYCLIASRREHFNPCVFRGIPWSTSQVLSSTLGACSANGLICRLLDPLQDIDNQNDLMAYCSQPSPYAIATNTWLANNGYPLNRV
jgi:rSAM/selenodomain-associated transferase 1